MKHIVFNKLCYIDQAHAYKLMFITKGEGIEIMN